MGIKDILEEETIPKPKPTFNAMVEHGKASVSTVVESVEVEAVIGGCLQRIRLKGITPECTRDYLLSLDANAKMRDDFPSKNSGPKEIKTGLINSLTIKGGKYPGIDMVVVGEDGSGVAVGVPQKKRELFPQEIEKIASAEVVSGVKEMIAGKEGAMTFLSGQLGNGKQVNVKYSVYEGKGFFEGFELVEADK